MSPACDRDTRLTWGWAVLVALAARMWRLIRLRRVPGWLRLVHTWWGVFVSVTPKTAGSGLRKDYGRLRAADGVSFQVRLGEVYALPGA